MGLAEILDFGGWKLESLDSAVYLVLEGQSQPDDGVQVEDGPTTTETSTAGTSIPTVQWVAGGGRLVRFSSVFWSLHLLDDIRPKVEALEALAKLDPSLGRAPRVSFTWGDLAVEGFVVGVSRRYTGWWPVSGYPKTVAFDLSIREAVPVTASSSSGETQRLVLAAGETFEALGLRFYGDPMKGELIRRENPALADGEVVGDRVKVLEREHPRVRGLVPRPLAPPFLDRSRDASTWQPILDALGSSRGRELAGIPWALQPDVVAGLAGVNVNLDPLVGQLPGSLTEGDDARYVLERLLTPIAQVEDLLQRRRRELADLLDPAACPDHLVRYLAGLVGMGRDLPAAYALDTTTLRKLAAVAVALWKRKGTTTAYRSIAASLAGSRAVILTWFERRALSGGSASYVYTHGDIGGTPAVNYSPPEQVTDVWIADPAGTVDRELIARWLDVVRPATERINLFFASFVDDCGQGIPLWTWNTSGAWSADREARTITARGGAVFQAAVGGAEDSWADVHVLARVAFTSVGEFRFRITGNTYYRVIVNVGGWEVTLARVIAGVETTIGTVVQPLADGHAYRWTLEAWEGASDTTLRVYLEGDLLFDELDTTGGRPDVGTFAWGTDGPGDVAVLSGCIVWPPGTSPTRVGPSP